MKIPPLQLALTDEQLAKHRLVMMIPTYCFIAKLTLIVAASTVLMTRRNMNDIPPLRDEAMIDIDELAEKAKK